MQVLSSLKTAKQRHRDCQIVRRRGKVYVICKSNPRFKARQRCPPALPASVVNLLLPQALFKKCRLKQKNSVSDGIFFRQYESGMCLKYSINRYQNSVAAAAPSSTRALISATSRRARFCLRLKRRLIISAASAKKKKIRKSLPIISGSGKPSEKYGPCAAVWGSNASGCLPGRVKKSYRLRYNNAFRRICWNRI